VFQQVDKGLVYQLNLIEQEFNAVYLNIQCMQVKQLKAMIPGAKRSMHFTLDVGLCLLTSAITKLVKIERGLFYQAKYIKQNAMLFHFYIQYKQAKINKHFTLESCLQ